MRPMASGTVEMISILSLLLLNGHATYGWGAIDCLALTECHERAYSPWDNSKRKLHNVRDGSHGRHMCCKPFKDDLRHIKHFSVCEYG